MPLLDLTVRELTALSQQQRSRSVEGDGRIYEFGRTNTEKQMLKPRFETDTSGT
jgi:hypothetical protein